MTHKKLIYKELKKFLRENGCKRKYFKHCGFTQFEDPAAFILFVYESSLDPRMETEHSLCLLFNRLLNYRLLIECNVLCDVAYWLDIENRWFNYVIKNNLAEKYLSIKSKFTYEL